MPELNFADGTKNPETREIYFMQKLVTLKYILFLREKLTFIMIPLIQKQLNEFQCMVWNNHRIRFQKNTLMPDGIPNYIYDFPERYELEQCGNILLSGLWWKKLQNIPAPF